MRRVCPSVVLIVLALGLGGCFGGGSPPVEQTMYTVSGAIVDTAGNPLADAVLHFSGTTDVAQTGADGKWTQAGLMGRVTVTPALDSYTFDPAARDVTGARNDVNFVGTKEVEPDPTYSVLGTIKDLLGNPVAGVTVNFTGGRAPVTTGADGAWSGSGLSGIVTVTPAHADYTFSPPSYTVSAAGSFYFTATPIAMGNCAAGDPDDPNDPCIIINVDQLQAIGDTELNGHYALGADINARATVGWDLDKYYRGFKPIGDCTITTHTNEPFTGTFDGRGFTIDNLYIRRLQEANIGLFGCLGDGARVFDVGLTNVNMEGFSQVGGLVGYSRDDAVITNAYTTGKVVGKTEVGGLVGYLADGAQIIGSYSEAQIPGSIETMHNLGATNMGGLVGLSNHGIITASHSTGDVQGYYRIGGLAGRAVNSVITDSYSTSNVTGSNMRIGGLVGDGGMIIRSHSTGNVTGTGEVGGLAGHGYDISDSYSSSTVTASGGRAGGLVGHGGDVTNSHSTGDVTGGNDGIGGLLGSNTGSITDSYSTGTVTGTGYAIGGLVGSNYTADDITRSYSTGDVFGVQGVGGLVGVNDNRARVIQSFSTGNVTGESSVGGLVGAHLDAARIIQSYSTGTVTGEDDVGGLVGTGTAIAEIVNSYSTGSVTGITAVGGLVGSTYDDATIAYSYSIGKVTGTTSVGGFLGLQQSSKPVISSYWDTETSERSNSAGTAQGKSTADMKQQSTYKQWNFGEVWQPMSGGYPDLQDNAR